ncbi:hypothetical protein PM082_003400 [Marasmius tenuissimus]|nr:hypothetical protein PM082_003400 [Marasmius tenuissimus]
MLVLPSSLQLDCLTFMPEMASEEGMNLDSGPNTIHPIARIPTEILAEIFSFCTPSDYFQPTVSTVQERLREWLNFTHVCQDWRTIALSTPSLWTSPDFRIPPLSREMLTRSKPALLDLRLMDFPIVYSQSPEVACGLLTDVLNELGRIRSLELEMFLSSYYNDLSLMEEIMKVLARPAPSLRSFSLGIFYDQFVGPDRLLSLPRIALGSYPCLTELILDDCDLPGDSGWLRNLTILKIDCVSRPVRQPPTIAQFVEYLGTMPHLTILELVGYLPCFYSQRPKTHSPPMLLPNLKRLVLMSSILRIASILSYILPPATATICITCYETSRALPDTEEALSIVLAFIADIHGPGTSRRIEALEVCDNDRDANTHGVLIIKTWAAVIDETDDIDDNFTPRPNFRVDLYCNESDIEARDRSLLHIADKILSLVPLGELKTLTYCWLLEPARFLRRHFGSLMSLESITDVRGYHFNKVIATLAEMRSEESTSGVLFPALRQVVLLKITCTARIAADPDEEMWGAFFWHNFEARRNLGGHIPMLVLKRCQNVDVKQVQWLEERGVRVKLLQVDLLEAAN